MLQNTAQGLGLGGCGKRGDESFGSVQNETFSAR
jgi:hypothetical protein